MLDASSHKLLYVTLQLNVVAIETLVMQSKWFLTDWLLVLLPQNINPEF